MIVKTYMMIVILMMHRVLLSLGSNLNFRKKNIERAIKYLNRSRYMNVIHISSLYETSPMYNSNQEDFINCAIEIQTSLTPLELLDQTQIIEKKIGRNRNLNRNQPRKIDIDILTYNDEIINENNLIIPHPRINERKFVLIPLLELKGNISISRNIEKIEDLIKKLNKNSDKIRKCNYKINEENLSYSS